jgi:hypothetical protein
MKIVVYFETPKYNFAEVVAQFADDEIYNRCLPILESYAHENGWVVTESMREDEKITDAFDEEK